MSFIEKEVVDIHGYTPVSVGTGIEEGYDLEFRVWGPIDELELSPDRRIVFCPIQRRLYDHNVEDDVLGEEVEPSVPERAQKYSEEVFQTHVYGFKTRHSSDGIYLENPEDIVVVENIDSEEELDNILVEELKKRWGTELHFGPPEADVILDSKNQ